MMKVTKRQRTEDKHVWTVSFNEKQLDKVSKVKGNKSGSTYEAEEQFVLTMKVADGSTGMVARDSKVAGIVEMDYKVSFLEETESSVKVRFDFADGRRFDTVMKKSRGFATGAFYKFFHYAVTKTPVFLDSPSVEVVDPVHATLSELESLATSEEAVTEE